MDITYNNYLKKYSRKLRKQGTYAEVLLWSILRKRQIKGYRFNRQKPIGKYIVDFYCSKLKLVIEVDGISHDDKYEQDFQRQNDIEKFGVNFMRFLDEEVKENIDGVCLAIIQYIDEYEGKNSIVNNKSVDIEW